MATLTQADIKGIPAITIAEGERLGTVARVYLHRDDKRVEGFGVNPGRTWFEPDAALLIDADRITSLGPDVLTISDRAAISGETIARVFERLVDANEVVGRSVVTDSGRRLGNVSGVRFDAQTFTVTELTLSSGKRGSQDHHIPIDRVTTLGLDQVMVKTDDGDRESSPAGLPVSGDGKENSSMNHAHLQGLAVISIAEGEKVGSVSRLLLDLGGRKIAGLEVKAAGGLLAPTAGFWILLPEDVHAVGPDAVTIDDRSKLRETALEAVENPPTPLQDVLGRKVVTEGGTFFGTVAAAKFDDHRLELTHLEVSPGFLKTNRLVPIDQVVNLGNELVVVADAVSEIPVPAEPAAESDDDRLVSGDAEPVRSEAASGS